MAADILGQRIERDVGAVFDRPLEDRAEQRVVAGDDRRMALFSADRVGNAADHGDINEAVGRVRRRLDQDHGDTALGHRRFGRSRHRRFVDAIGKADGGDSEIEEGAGKQRLGAAIERLAVQDRVTRLDEGEQRRGDRRHARREQRAAFGALVDGEAVFDNLAVRMVEARIDEAGADARRRLATAGNEVEEVAALFGRAEDEGGGQEHRRLDGALGQFRIVAIVQHLRFGMQLVVSDMGLGGMRCGHDLSPDGKRTRLTGKLYQMLGLILAISGSMSLSCAKIWLS